MSSIFFDDQYTVNTADLDGATGYLNRGSDLTGSADSTQGIFSGWFRLDGGNATNLQILYGAGGKVSIARGSDNKFRFLFTDSAITNAFQFETTSTYTSSTSWIHVLASWDTNFSTGNKLSHLYINNTSDKAVTADGPSFTIDYTVADYTVGNLSSDYFNGCMADIYFAPGQFLDFSNSGNRAKFIANSRPAFLDFTGSTPTGTAPKLYLRNPAATFEVNSGTGGSLTRHGTIATGTTNP